MIYRQKRNYENLDKAMFIGAGAFDIPLAVFLCQKQQFGGLITRW